MPASLYLCGGLKVHFNQRSTLGSDVAAFISTWQLLKCEYTHNNEQLKGYENLQQGTFHLLRVMLFFYEELEGARRHSDLHLPPYEIASMK